MIANYDSYEFTSAFLDKTLKSWNSEHDAAGRRSFIDKVISDAEAEAKSGNVSRAIELLQSASDLYKDDGTVAQQFARCEEMLREFEKRNKTPNDAADN